MSGWCNVYPGPSRDWPINLNGDEIGNDIACTVQNSHNFNPISNCGVENDVLLKREAVKSCQEPLAELTAQRLSEWLEKEAVTRPTNAAQSYRLLRAFIRWTADFPAYRGIVAAEAYSSRTFGTRYRRVGLRKAIACSASSYPPGLPLFA